jgi:hypothetical protein
MAQIIKPKRSETASSVPSASDLAVHEIAMNPTDQKIYTKKADGTVVIVASHVDTGDAQITEGDALAFSIALG